MSTLECHRWVGGPRFFLDGAPVAAGFLLEAWTVRQRWEPVRFECVWKGDDAGVEPRILDAKDRALPLETPCRWPRRQRHGWWGGLQRD